jgi:hypothetical protein
MPIVVRVWRTPIADIRGSTCTVAETIAKLEASGWTTFPSKSPYPTFVHPDVMTQRDAEKLLADADIGCELDEEDAE